jgi:hypothetical protein
MDCTTSYSRCISNKCIELNCYRQFHPIVSVFLIRAAAAGRPQRNPPASGRALVTRHLMAALLRQWTAKARLISACCSSCSRTLLDATLTSGFSVRTAAADKTLIEEMNSVWIRLVAFVRHES